MDSRSENEVFADSFFYIAVINRHDAQHDAATKFANEFGGRYVTTQWVLTEVADAFAESICRKDLGAYFRALAADPKVRIIEVSPDGFARGLGLYEARRDKEWSLTDCISFGVMSDEGLREALTEDHHFKQAGFSPVFAR